MTLLEHRITLNRNPAEVFAYVTTPAYWPDWHPSSLRLAPGADFPLPAGARFEEDVRAGGREGHLSWQVQSCEAPHRWVASAVMSNGGQLVLTYQVRAQAAGAQFERRLEYQMPNLWWRLLDRALLRRRIERESEVSLQRLKTVLETGADRSGRNDLGADLSGSQGRF